MIKNKGNLSKALQELKADKNNTVAFLYEEAKKQGDGILNETIVTIKDVYATIDAPTQGSSKILEGFQTHYDAEVITRLKNAGAIIVAKTHTDELALGGTGTFSAYGIVANPLDLTRMVGGSSSGAAATFTKSIGIALGSDTGDSVRLPASWVGIDGFKPSYGAISRYGQFAFASSLDTVAYFAHNVSDLITTSQVLYGVDKKDMSSREVTKPEHELKKPSTVAFLENTEFLSEYAKKAYADLRIKLEKEGIKVNTYKLDEKLLKAIDTSYMVISFSEASSNNANLNGVAFGNTKDGSDWMSQMTNTRSEGFGRMVQRRFALGAFYLQAANQKDIFEKAQKVRRLIVDMFNNLYKENDLLIFPSTAIAPKITEGKLNNWFSSYLTHANLSGNPSLTLKWEKGKDLPFGIQLDSKLYNDKDLLSYGLFIERLIGGSIE